MSTIWSRGAICGIDNCPSRLYRTIDGRKICQHGHVQQDDIEINDDEDDNFILTRRLKVPSSMSQSQSQLLRSTQQQQRELAAKARVFGMKGRVLFYEAFQYILVRQCEKIIEVFGLTSESGQESRRILDRLKLNYMKYLKARNVSISIVSELQKKLPKFTHIIPLIYLTIHELQQYPTIYLMDIYHKIMTNELPYLYASNLLPDEIRDRLPAFYLYALRPAVLPNFGELYMETLSLNKTLQIGVKLNYSGLILKMIKRLYLPLDLFQMVEKMISKVLKLDLQYLPIAKIYHSPDAKIASCMVEAIKIFGLQNNSESGWNFFMKWIKCMQLAPHKYLDHEIELEKIVDWSAEKVDDYLEMVSKFIMDPLKDTTQKNKDIAKKRVDDIFVPTIDTTSDPTKKLTLEKVYQSYSAKDEDDSTPLKELPQDIEKYIIEKVAACMGMTDEQIVETHHYVFVKNFPSKTNETTTTTITTQ